MALDRAVRNANEKFAPRTIGAHPGVVSEGRGFLIRSALSGVGCWDSPWAVGRGRALRVGSALPALPKRLRGFTNNIGMRHGPSEWFLKVSRLCEDDPVRLASQAWVMRFHEHGTTVEKFIAALECFLLQSFHGFMGIKRQVRGQEGVGQSE